MAGFLQLLEAYVMVVGGALVFIGLLTTLPVKFWSGAREIPLGYYFAFIFIGDLLLMICSSLFASK